MIRLSRLNSKEFYVNPDLIIFIEATPDTVITLSNGTKFVVEEEIDAVIERIIEYRRRIYASLPVVVEKD